MTDEPNQPCPECAGRRVVPSSLVMQFIRKHGVAAWQVGLAIRDMEESQWGRSGYDPALYSEAGFDEAAADELQDAADAYQLHACPLCAPGENADTPRQQARDAIMAYLAKLSAQQEGAESA